MPPTAVICLRFVGGLSCKLPFATPFEIPACSRGPRALGRAIACAVLGEFDVPFVFGGGEDWVACDLRISSYTVGARNNKLGILSR